MLRDILLNAGLAEGLATFIDLLIGVIIAASFGLLMVLFTGWTERKIVARMQDRVGPNRVGPWGILQMVADGIKAVSKEVIVPVNADRPVYFLAPLLSVASVVLIAAVIPFSNVVIGTDLNIGILYVMAVSSLGAIAILMAGWGSNNKYALLGAFRAVAQLVSYEVPMIAALLVPVFLAGTMSMQSLVENQHVWFIVAAPLAAFLFFISSHAEVGRAPFDLLEAESEIVAGYHIEYSGMAFLMFLAAEFAHSFFVSILFVVLFLGGWKGPLAEEIPVLGSVYLLGKAFLVYFVQMWIRFTVPRIRIDQLLDFNWKLLVPLSLVNLLVMAFFFQIIPAPDYEAARAIASSDLSSVAGGLYRLIGPETVAELPRAGLLLIVNVVMILGTLEVLRRIGRRNRGRVEALVDEGIYSRPEAATAPDAAASAR